MRFGTATSFPHDRFHRRVSVSSETVYRVGLADDLLGEGFSRLAMELDGRRGIVVTTPTVASLYAGRLMRRIEEQGFDYTLIVIDCDEASKSFDHVMRICDAALDRGLERRAMLVAFGGGVCSDLVTVAASLYRRGIATVRIPTTLIGQIDAGIGIKGAVNHGGKKSSLGCFYAPTQVLIDSAFLSSLPARHLRAGMAEIIKMALIRDARLFELVELHGAALATSGAAWASDHGSEILWRSITAMLAELEPNLFETSSFERPVDLGHSFSPLVEAASDYAVAHGEAVAIDMVISGAVAVILGLLDERDWRRYTGLIERLGLPTASRHLGVSAQRSSLVEMARHRGGVPNLVVPTGIGTVAILSDMTLFDDAVLAAADRMVRMVEVAK